MQTTASKLSIFSFIASLLIVLPVLSGICAIVLGIMALIHTSAKSEKFNEKYFSFLGIALGSLQLLFVLAIAGLIFISAQHDARKKTIVGLQEKHSLKPGIEPHDRIINQEFQKGEFLENHQKGFELMGTEKKNEAFDHFQRAADIGKRQLASAYYGMGSIRMNQDKYQDALKYLNLALEHNPKHYDAYQNKAVTYRLMGQYEKSIEACKKTISLFPDSGKSYCSLGWAYEHNKDYEQAALSHIEAINLAPDWDFPKSRFQTAILNIKNIEKTQELLKKLEKIDPKLASQIRKTLNNK